MRGPSLINMIGHNNSATFAVLSKYECLLKSLYLRCILTCVFRHVLLWDIDVN